MLKLLFFQRIGAVLAGVVLTVCLAVPFALCQGTGIGEPSHHNQRGLGYFEKGFYSHAPKQDVSEAEKNYGLAVKEFKAAIAKDSSYVAAHRNLARVYYVQKNFDGAAEEYKKVTELEPGDLDAYVNLALSFIELKRFDDAVLALENAKGQASDPKVLNTLDTYITKTRAHQAKGVK